MINPDSLRVLFYDNLIWKILIVQLDKLLQTQGFGSRKHCQQLIKNGQVQVQGETVNDPKTKLNLTQLKYSVFGEEFLYREKVYLALFKPKGYECSHQPQYHHSVFDLLPEYLLAREVQTVGRLDQDTTGLLLLTDDGKYLHALTHPRKHVAKYYQVNTADEISETQIAQLQQGVELKNEKGIFAVTDLKLLDSHSCIFAVHQGVYHQVKRMLSAVGNHVQALHRVQIGALNLSHLPLQEGDWCYLEEHEYHAALQSP